MRKRGCEQAPASTCSAAEGCADGRWQLMVSAHPAQACRGTNGVRSPVLPQQRFSPISRKVNNQRLCLPRFPAVSPAFVAVPFNIEDLIEHSQQGHLFILSSAWNSRCRSVPSRTFGSSFPTADPSNFCAFSSCFIKLARPLRRPTWSYRSHVPLLICFRIAASSS